MANVLVISNYSFLFSTLFGLFLSMKRRFSFIFHHGLWILVIGLLIFSTWSAYYIKFENRRNSISFFKPSYYRLQLMRRGSDMSKCNLFNESNPLNHQYHHHHHHHHHHQTTPTPWSRLSWKYQLYLYREIINATSTMKDINKIYDVFDIESMRSLKLKGWPVLFIHGHAGSYQQAKIFASESSRQENLLSPDSEKFYFYQKLFNTSDVSTHLDFFTIDFNEELSALHGASVLDQAEYVNDVIRFILYIYQYHSSWSNSTSNSQNDDSSSSYSTISGSTASFPRSSPPDHVILLGHSMGGITARLMPLLKNYRPGSFKTLLTLCTPHEAPVIGLEYDITQIYEIIQQDWKKNGVNEDFVIGSLISGSRDIIVPSDLSWLSNPSNHRPHIDDHHQNEYSDNDVLKIINGPTSNTVTNSDKSSKYVINAFLTSVPFVWMTIEHDGVLWCHEVTSKMVHILRALVNLEFDENPIENKKDARMKILKKYMQEPNDFLNEKDDVEEEQELEKNQLKQHSSNPAMAKYANGFRNGRSNETLLDDNMKKKNSSIPLYLDIILDDTVVYEKMSRSELASIYTKKNLNDLLDQKEYLVFHYYNHDRRHYQQPMELELSNSTGLTTTDSLEINSNFLLGYHFLFLTSPSVKMNDKKLRIELESDVAFHGKSKHYPYHTYSLEMMNNLKSAFTLHFTQYSLAVQKDHDAIFIFCGSKGGCIKYMNYYYYPYRLQAPEEDMENSDIIHLPSVMSINTFDKIEFEKENQIENENEDENKDQFQSKYLQRLLPSFTQEFEDLENQEPYDHYYILKERINMFQRKNNNSHHFIAFDWNLKKKYVKSQVLIPYEPWNWFLGSKIEISIKASMQGKGLWWRNGIVLSNLDSRYVILSASLVPIENDEVDEKESHAKNILIHNDDVIKPIIRLESSQTGEIKYWTNIEIDSNIYQKIRLNSHSFPFVSFPFSNEAMRTNWTISVFRDPRISYKLELTYDHLAIAGWIIKRYWTFIVIFSFVLILVSLLTCLLEHEHESEYLSKKADLSRMIFIPFLAHLKSTFFKGFLYWTCLSAGICWFHSFCLNHAHQNQFYYYVANSWLMGGLTPTIWVIFFLSLLSFGMTSLLYFCNILCLRLLSSLIIRYSNYLPSLIYRRIFLLSKKIENDSNTVMTNPRSSFSERKWLSRGKGIFILFIVAVCSPYQYAFMVNYFFLGLGCLRTVMIIQIIQNINTKKNSRINQIYENILDCSQGPLNSLLLKENTEWSILYLSRLLSIQFAFHLWFGLLVSLNTPSLLVWIRNLSIPWLSFSDHSLIKVLPISSFLWCWGNHLTISPFMDLLHKRKGFKRLISTCFWIHIFYVGLYGVQKPYILYDSSNFMLGLLFILISLDLFVSSSFFYAKENPRCTTTSESKMRDRDRDQNIRTDPYPHSQTQTYNSYRELLHQDSSCKENNLSAEKNHHVIVDNFFRVLPLPSTSSKLYDNLDGRL